MSKPLKCRVLFYVPSLASCQEDMSVTLRICSLLDFSPLLHLSLLELQTKYLGLEGGVKSRETLSSPSLISQVLTYSEF